MGHAHKLFAWRNAIEYFQEIFVAWYAMLFKNFRPMEWDEIVLFHAKPEMSGETSLWLTLNGNENRL